VIRIPETIMLRVAYSAPKIFADEFFECLFACHGANTTASNCRVLRDYEKVIKKEIGLAS